MKQMMLVALAAQRNVATVLVVDDETDIREAVRDVIESSLDGMRVFTADSGKAALDILRREKVDLIITDYKMPGMTGIELLGAAETLLPGVRHILITAFDRELVQELGPGGTKERIVQKPLEPVRLIREVERALKR